MGGGGGVAERGWVMRFWALCKGWFVQLTATLRGWVILFYNIDRQVLILTGQLTAQLKLLLKILSNLCPCAILIKSTIFFFTFHCCLKFWYLSVVTYVVTYILERKQTKKHEVLFVFIKISINIMTVKQAEFMERYLNGGLQNETDKKKITFGPIIASVTLKALSL